MSTWRELQPVGNVDKTWYTIGCSENGSYILAANFIYGQGAIYVSSDGGGTWPCVLGGLYGLYNGWVSRTGQYMLVCSIGNSVSGVKLFRSTNFGVSWVDITANCPHPGTTIAAWKSCYISDDGQVLYVSNNAININTYRSIDGGTTWSAITITDGTHSIYGGEYISANDIGSKICIAYNGTTSYPIWYSNDYGATWTNISPTTSLTFGYNGVAMNVDASIIYASSNGRVYVSTNQGTSWTELYPAGAALNKNYSSMHCSDDGLKFIVSASNIIYTTIDGGITWTIETTVSGFRVSVTRDGEYFIVSSTRLYTTVPAQSPPDGWTGVSISSDGSKIVCADWNGRVFTSNDYGNTWIERYPTGTAVDKPWNTVTMSSDGLHIVVGELPGRLYYSEDGGITWSEEKPAGSVDKNWIASCAA